jgi:hypothetical protein
MSKLPPWLPILIERISWGCSTSPLLLDLVDDERVLEVGRETCADLWPFIRDLATNIGTVRDMLPDNATGASKLLSQLADDERHYQRLFVDQCVLAGIPEGDLASLKATSANGKLCEVMSTYCRKTYVDGIYAIVAAELAATAFARNALPHYERHFEKNAEKFDDGVIERGLQWLRLHAQQQTRHALWMRRMFGEIEAGSSTTIPKPVEHVLQAVFKLWRCPPEPPIVTPTPNVELESCR